MAKRGRITKYDAKRVAEEITRYLSACKPHFYLPTVEGLAVHLEVSGSTIYRWRDEHPEFRDILEQILALASGAKHRRKGSLPLAALRAQRHFSPLLRHFVPRPFGSHVDGLFGALLCLLGVTPIFFCARFHD